MDYSVDYFINKFQSIPDDNWTIYSLRNVNNPDCRCVLGHCDVTTENGGNYIYTEESWALYKIFKNLVPTLHKNPYLVSTVNDYKIEWGLTPKERILNVLNKAKNESAKSS